MPKFKVNVREVHIQPYIIEAEDADKAKELVADGDGQVVEWEMEYSHTLDPDTWTVEETTNDSIRGN